MRRQCLASIAIAVAIANMPNVVESGRNASPRATSSASNSGSTEELPGVLPDAGPSQTLPPAATVRFDIPAEPLSSALLDFGRQAQVSLVLPTRPFEGFISAPVHAELSADDALAQLLRCLPFHGRTQDGALIITDRDRSTLDVAPPSAPVACETRLALVS
jgi:hypothetical protein